MNDPEYIEYLQDCGFDEKEIEQKIKDRLKVRLSMSEKSQSQPRNITCQNYERSQKRLFNQVASFVSGK